MYNTNIKLILIKILQNHKSIQNQIKGHPQYISNYNYIGKKYLPFGLRYRENDFQYPGCT